jgi:hypothetical protein
VPFNCYYAPIPGYKQCAGVLLYNNLASIILSARCSDSRKRTHFDTHMRCPILNASGLAVTRFASESSPAPSAFHRNPQTTSTIVINKYHTINPLQRSPICSPRANLSAVPMADLHLRLPGAIS